MKARIVHIVLGIICTVFFLAVALYRVPLELVGALIASANLLWIAAALLIYVLNLGLRAWRWQIILLQVERISYPIVARALLVGYGLNTIMPARIGELLRAEFLKQNHGVSRVWALTSIVIERVFDGLAVVACLGIGLFMTTAVNQNAGMMIDVLVTAAVTFGTILLVAVGLARLPLPAGFGRFPELAAQIKMVQRGLDVLHTWRTSEIATLTLMIYLPDAMSLWCIVKSLGLQLDLAGTLVLVGGASLSTLVPSGPAFLGTLQFAYALVIEFTGGSRALGIAAATLAQMCLLLPMAILAVGIFVHTSGSTLRTIFGRRDPDVVSTDQ